MDIPEATPTMGGEPSLSHKVQGSWNMTVKNLDVSSVKL